MGGIFNNKIGQKQRIYIHTFFYKNTLFFSEPDIFLNSRPIFDLLGGIFPHFLKKNGTKSQPWYSYKKYSYIKKCVQNKIQSN